MLLNGEPQKLHIQSPDTDVFVLALRQFPQLCPSTCMIIGSGNSQQVVPLKPIYNALGDLKASALPGLHAFTGADQTGKFAGKSKLTCWKICQKTNENVLDAFTSLGKSQKLSDATITGIEQYVCQLYIPSTQITETGPLCWNLFSKKQAEAEKLPPTHGALVEKIMRAHYQVCMVA